jgi:hypothetical protein
MAKIGDSVLSFVLCPHMAMDQNSEALKTVLGAENQL